MADTTIPTYDEEYNIVLKGYDVAIVPSDQGPGMYFVTLYEQGTEAFKDDIPIPEPQPGETEEESIQNLAQAAIDIFEASRETLGEGAGVEMKANKQIKACGLELGHEEWFMGFKGTTYENLAYDLLKNYYSTDFEQTAQDDALHELYDEKSKLEYELKMLDLERMKAAPPNTQIIVIQGKKAYLGEADMYKEFLAKFKGDPLEGQVVKLLNNLLDVKQQIRTHEEGQETYWEQLIEIERQMEALSEEALQANVLEKIPTQGIEAFPNMAGELAELMEGVEMDEPLEPMIPNPFQASRRAQAKLSLEDIEEDDIVEYRDLYGYIVKGKVVKVGTSTAGQPFVAIDSFAARFPLSDIGSIVKKASRRAQMTPPEEPDDIYAQEWESVEDRIQEKGEIHEGLDPAETLDDIPFREGDKVKLTKKFETTAPINGVKIEFSSGSIGYIESELDRNGDCYQVAFDDGGCVRVPAEYLKSA